MNPPAPETEFAALAGGGVAWVQVSGPAVCRESGRFESILRQVETGGFRTMVIDLARCPRMDSTFAGALLRLASRAGGANADAGQLRVLVSGAAGPVAELLDTLCLDAVLTRVELPPPQSVAALELEARDLPREEIMALSLDGHERLAALNEANARRFATLLGVLRQQRRTGTVPPGAASGGG